MVEDSEREIRYNNRLTFEQLMEMDYVEYHFQCDYLREKKAEDTKNRWIAASFTAWQINSFNGLKRSWNEYLRDLGLAEKKEVTKRQKVELEQTTARILKKLGRI